MTQPKGQVPRHSDVIVVGAGFSGLYLIHKLRSLGFEVLVLEAGSDIGGTWFWNRYPGARCDVESMQYSFSFSEEIQQEWVWTELYARQPEILRYINFVADKLKLRPNIRLNTRVVAATFDEVDKKWVISAEDEEQFVAPFVVMASGCLSIPLAPSFDGVENFGGKVLSTTDWPREPVDFTGKRVGLIGTGSTGIQITPEIAEQANQLFVFQRTPNYSLPARNRPLEPEFVASWKQSYPEHRRAALKTRNNTLNNAGLRPGSDFTHEEREAEFERRWQAGGVGFMYAFTDTTTNPEVNAHASAFVRAKIASIVHDPETAKKLAPTTYGIGGKRICVDTGYFETFNRDNVTLVNIENEPIEAITNAGIRTGAKDYSLDVIVLAVGFDAMTGALARIDISGRNGRKLRDHWAEGPRTYLGMAISGFPNMFLITGPGSPSVFTNMVASIEQHVDWIAACLYHLRSTDQTSIEANEKAEQKWYDHVSEIGSKTVLPNGNSWYIGANVPGKPRVVMPYLGGAATYADICEEVARNGYDGFNFT